MVSLIEKLMYLYPLADAELFGVYAESGAQSIKNWQQPFEQPTQVMLDAVTQVDIDLYTLLSKRKSMIVTPWQFLKALNIKGIRTEVESIVAQAPQDTQDGYHRASSFERLDPLVVSVGYALEKSDEYLDELFELAGSL